MGRSIQFKPATFYLNVVDHLAGEVEGQPSLEEMRDETSPKSKPTADESKTKTTNDTQTENTEASS